MKIHTLPSNLYAGITVGHNKTSLLKNTSSIQSMCDCFQLYSVIALVIEGLKSKVCTRNKRYHIVFCTEHSVET